uniref:Uncharacterized protein n=1 Tax=Anguilla anguilla TaxID=7936 RepID=A0A0E9UQL6_ANGAN
MQSIGKMSARSIATEEAILLARMTDMDPAPECLGCL